MNPTPHVVEEAIRWMVLLQSGQASAEDYDACMRWRQADAQHQTAWDRLGAVNQQVQQIPPKVAHVTLHDEGGTQQRIKAMMQRRQALKLVVLVGGTAGLFGLGYQKLPWRPLLADYATGVGETRQLALSDGSDIRLNTASALDVDYDANLRLLRFYRGEILFTTGHAHGSSDRPFIVDTGHGRVRALGTRFLLREQEDGIMVSVFEGAVEVAAAGGKATVPAGQALFFTRQYLGVAQAVNADSIAWINGVVVARNMPLGALLKELERYRHGAIKCAPEVAEVRISGVFPLNDIDKALEAVSDTLGLAVRRSWFYWTYVGPAVPPSS
ncbi:FecR domain-containing protein [Methylobacillus pratensis]